MLLTERLELESLRADHAEEIAPLFDDQRLHIFIGGRETLRGRPSVEP